MVAGQSRRWCFTLNNYSDSDEADLASRVSHDIQFLYYGREVGEEGTRHLQGYLELFRKKRMGGVKKIKGLSRAHIEIARGTQSENIRYCGKGGVVVRLGDAMEEVSGGSRKRLGLVKAQLDSGKSMQEVADGDFSLWCQYRRSFYAYQQLSLSGRRWKSFTVVLYGPTGTGKTRFVHEMCQGDTLWTWGGDGMWFDGYCGQRVCLFDDFDGAHGTEKSRISYRRLLRLLDRYPERVPIKGGYVEWCPRKIYITTNLDPSDWYPQEDYAPLERRLNLITPTHDWNWAN